MLRLLREAEPRVGDQPRRVDAPPDRASDAGPQLGHHLADHVRVDGPVVHVDALATPVHHHERHPRLRDHGHHRGVGPAAAHVVDQPGPRLHRRACHRGAHRVDADDDALAGELPHHGHDPPQLLRLVHPRRARPGRLPPDVDEIRALGHQLHAAFGRRLGVEPPPAVGERVRCDIDHPHDRAAVPAGQAGHVTGRVAHAPRVGAGRPPPGCLHRGNRAGTARPRVVLTEWAGCRR